MSVLFSSVWVRIFTQYHIYGLIWYSLTCKIIYSKDSPTGERQRVRESLRALHKELEFPGQPNAHLLSFQMVASQCFSPLSGYNLIFTFTYLPLGLHSLPLCENEAFQLFLECTCRTHSYIHYYVGDSVSGQA